jgi:2,3-bisphosphoglycerate-dependent phosphoglycerate mutase
MKLYIVRHCKAMGQYPEAELTAEGLTQAEILADFLVVRGIETIISSPFVRTIRSIQPLAQRLNLEIKIDDRLAERVLGSENLPDWMDHLHISFNDLDRCLPGGESSREAMNRIVSVIDEVLTTDFKNMAVIFFFICRCTYLFYFFNRSSIISISSRFQITITVI